MNVTEDCRICLKGLAGKTTALSGGDESLLVRCFRRIDELHAQNLTPPAISNIILKEIKEATGAYDPFGALKEKELEDARRVFLSLGDLRQAPLGEVLKVSAMGNSSDFFDSGGYETDNIIFRTDIDKIAREIYIRGKETMMLSDNLGDFIFDMPLVRFLESVGKTVYYAVKEHPVQNDLSLFDVERFGLRGVFNRIISTGTDEVGIRREQMRGKVKEVFENNGLVIAKGMGNYETMSEYKTERTVIHIMKVKCTAVSASLREAVGTHIAKTGGEQNG
jgi:damage-control phosphatase, subfamily I